MNESTCNPAVIERLGNQQPDHEAETPNGARVDAVDVSRRVGARQVLPAWLRGSLRVPASPQRDSRGRG